MVLPNTKIIRVTSDDVDPAKLDTTSATGSSGSPTVQVFTLEGIGHGDPLALMGGTIINEYTALQIPAYLSGVRFIAETIARLPKRVYQKKNGIPQPVDEHAAGWTLNDEPNQLQTPFALWSTFMLHAVNWSNGYAAIRRQMGETELFNLPPDRVIPFRFNGVQWYAYDTGEPTSASNPNSRYLIFASEEIIHLPALSFDGMRGLGTVNLMQDTLRTTKSTEAHVGKFYSQGGLMGGSVETDQKLSKEQITEIRDTIRNEYSGINNANKWLILANGAKAKTLMPNLDVAQTDKNRSFSIIEICRILRLPPHILYELSRATWANIESMGIELVKYSLANWTTPLEQELTRKLLTRTERKAGMYIACDFAALLRGDHAAQIDAAVKRTQNGLTTPDEERAVWNLPPYPDGTGSTPRVAANTIPLGTPAAAPAAPAAPSNPPPATEDDDLAQRAIAAAAERVGRKTEHALDNARRKFADNAAGFTPWGNAFAEEQVKYAAAEVRVIAPDLATRAGEAYGHELRAFFSAVNRHETAVAPDLAAIITRIKGA